MWLKILLYAVSHQAWTWPTTLYENEKLWSQTQLMRICFSNPTILWKIKHDKISTYLLTFLSDIWSIFLFEIHVIPNSHCPLPPSLSLARCVWTAFALTCPTLSLCLFSGLSDLLSILEGGVTSEDSRNFSCRWSPPGWLLDEYLRAWRHKLAI